MKLIFGCFILIKFSLAIGQEEKVIYQYKKYERFDLGNLEIKGQLIAPGDLSVRERERKRFGLELFSRKDFDEARKRDLDGLR
jgi:hypothetical protein